MHLALAFGESGQVSSGLQVQQTPSVSALKASRSRVSAPGSYTACQVAKVAISPVGLQVKH